MIKTISNILSKEDVVYNTNKIKIIEMNDKYKFIPKIDDKNTRIKIGSKFYDLKNNEMHILKKNDMNKLNASIIEDKSTKFVLGNNLSDKEFNIFLNYNQIQNLKCVSVNKSRDVLSESSDFQFSLCKMDSIYCLSLSNFKKNVNYSILIEFKASFPNIRVKNLELKNEKNIDISTIEENYVNLRIPDNIEGEVKINSKKVDISRVNRKNKPITDFVSMDLYIDLKNDDSRKNIQEWVEKDLNVTLKTEDETIHKKKKLNNKINVFSFDDI